MPSELKIRNVAFKYIGWAAALIIAVISILNYLSAPTQAQATRIDALSKSFGDEVLERTRIDTKLTAETDQTKKDVQEIKDKLQKLNDMIATQNILITQQNAKLDLIISSFGLRKQ